MSSKRLACRAHRLVLTATPRQVTLRVTFPTKTPSATSKTALDSLKLSFTCSPPTKSSFEFENVDKATLKSTTFLRDKETVKEEIKGLTCPYRECQTIVPETGPLQCVSPIFTTPALGLSFKNTNAFSNQEARPASTPAAAVEKDEPKASVVATDGVEDDEFNYEEYKEDRRYKPEYLEQDLNRISHLNPHESYSSAYVIKKFSAVMLRMYPYINHAINEWYDIVGLPKVCMEPSEWMFEVVEFRVPGNLAKSLARHVGTRYMEWFNGQL
ncbi:hypothetical protein HDU81_001981 [Chytriomyces hyalinus]|nr:hypothetical protein HDU81_001981 [Chytriomyces hyalinus]